MPRPLYLYHGCAPGDITVLSALFRDIQLTYPGQYEIHFAGTCTPLLWYNPHVTKLYPCAVKEAPKTPEGNEFFRLNYGRYIGENNRKHGKRQHFITAFHENVSDKLGIKVVPQLPKGDLHLTEEEKATRPFPEKYWVTFPGWKTDFTTKRWSIYRWQQLVNALATCGIRCVQSGASGGMHKNPVLENVINHVGPVDLRGLLQIIYHAEGVICGITAAMHIAAAFDKPSVVIAGGREAWWWEAYQNEEPAFGPIASGKLKVPHRYLHTETLLDCCRYGGCWRNKIEKHEQDRGRSYCHKPTHDEVGQALPLCTDMISVEHALAAVLSYYEDGTLEPIGPKPTIILPNGHAVGFQTQNLAPRVQETIEIQSVATIAPPQVHRSPLASAKPKSAAKVELQRIGESINSPIIGGKMTIFVLMYGDYPDMHKQCLNSILSTIPPGQREIRIGCNEVCQETLTYLTRLHSQNHIQMVYNNPQNGKKYPMMRKMFYDPEHPITTKWVVWFDDDSICNKDPEWYSRLATAITELYPEGYRMFGRAMFWNFDQAQLDWVKSRPWYTGRQLQVSTGKESPNGRGVLFATGGFWALEVDSLRKANIPDPDIGHNGGDYMIGAQLWQAGGRTKGWNNQKQFVGESMVPRRGLAEKHTGKAGWVPGGCT